MTVLMMMILILLQQVLFSYQYFLFNEIFSPLNYIIFSFETKILFKLIFAFQTNIFLFIFVRTTTLQTWLILPRPSWKAATWTEMERYQRRWTCVVQIDAVNHSSSSSHIFFESWSICSEVALKVYPHSCSSGADSDLDGPCRSTMKTE